MRKTSQLTLAVQLPDDETFESFQLGANHLSVCQLKALIAEPVSVEQPQSCYLFGSSGSGKSHLLHAACTYAEHLGLATCCMSFAQLTELSVEVLEGLEHVDLLCLDDIHLIAGNMDWQRAVFDLFNRVMEQGNKLVITGNDSVKNIGFTLPDLVSRLAWGYTQRLKALEDDDKIIALAHRAKQRGMILSHDVARFLLTRLHRDMKSLIGSLDILDKASIREQRKITIPFIKDILFN